MAGWIKLHRQLMDKAFYSKDSEKVHLWIHLLMKANHHDREEYLGGKPIQCKSGQFTTGRKQLSMETGICESKIERILSNFEKIEQQIEQRKTSVNRLISILNWSIYQESEQQFEQQVNNDRTTSEQRVNTLQEYKEDKKLKNVRNIFVVPTIQEVIDYFEENGFGREYANKFFKGYEVANWTDSKGNKIKNWKQKAQHVWFKEELKKDKNGTDKKFNPGLSKAQQNADDYLRDLQGRLGSL